MQKQQGSVVLWIVAVVVVGTVLGGSLYVTERSKTETATSQQATTTQQTNATTTEAEEENVAEIETKEPAPQKVVTPPPPPPPVVVPDPPDPPQQEEVIAPEKTVEVVEEPVVEKVHIVADDDGADPSIINVTKGNTIELTFEVSTSNVRFGGLLFKSEDLNSGDVLPGESKTITFTAETSQSFGVFWPSSNHRKPYNANINVIEN